MKKVVVALSSIVWLTLLASGVGAQDYRARVQGLVVDSSQGALPGTTVTLTNDATGVAVTNVTNTDGRYIFDFVEPGTYTVVAELSGFKPAEQRNVRVQQRDEPHRRPVAQRRRRRRARRRRGAAGERCSSGAPVRTWSSSSSWSIRCRSPGRNPYNLASLDPSITVSPATNENRPYHHAYANDYDAGGGTRRANDVLLDGVALGASFKTAYTPAVDAVEEITVSKNSVDAENGHSLGGIISLNMKSGTNTAPRLGVLLRPRSQPQRHHRSDDSPDAWPGHVRAPRHRAAHVRRHVRRSDQAWEDLQLHVVRAVGRQAAATRSSGRCRPRPSAAATSASRS